MTAESTDLSQIEPLPCPLCAYDLRACEGPRCPECGGAFEPAQLREQLKQTNRLLFEHAPKPSVPAWLRAAWAANRPTYFWSSVRPAHVIRPRRLIRYWLMSLVLLSLTGLLITAVLAVRPLMNNYRMRSALLGQLNASMSQAAAFNGRMTAQQIADRYYPLLGSWRLYRSIWLHSRLAATLWLVSFCIFWPWLALATLMIFRWSLRKGRLRRVHLLRIVVYSTAIWPTLAVIVLYALLTLTDPPLYAAWPSLLLTELAGFILVIVMTWRLLRALQLYLQFNHALGVALSVQLIVLLTFICVFNDALPWNEHFSLWRALCAPFGFVHA